MKFYILFYFTFVSSAYGGIGSLGVACYQGEQLKTVEAIEFYRARMRPDWRVVPDVTLEAAIELAIGVISKYDSYLSDDLKDGFGNFSNRFKFASHLTFLAEQDPTLKVRENFDRCEIVRLADVLDVRFFKTLIDEDLVAHMPSLDYGAMILELLLMQRGHPSSEKIGALAKFVFRSLTGGFSNIKEYLHSLCAENQTYSQTIQDQRFEFDLYYWGSFLRMDYAGRVRRGFFVNQVNLNTIDEGVVSTKLAFVLFNKKMISEDYFPLETITSLPILVERCDIQ